jgi:predicted type IV restriction endonuclease
MSQSLRETLKDIRCKLVAGVYQNEEHVRLSLVARVLQALGWETGARDK